MGIFNDIIRMGASNASTYEVDRSLRFEYGSSDTAGPHLTRTPSSSGNLRTFTISVWVKKCTRPGAEGFADMQTIISNGGGGGGSYNGSLAFDTSDRLVWSQNNPAPTSHIYLQTTRKFRDCSNWYHIVLIQDTTNGTSGDRARLYINGVRETAFDSTTYPTQNYDGYFNNNTAHNIGANAIWGSLSTRYGHFNGYMSDFHFLDGTVKEPSKFGKTDTSTGQWIPIDYTDGSYGTNGFYLQFLDNTGATASTIGKDTSGETNNWTPSGISVTAGKDDDSMIDTPTNNFPTLNPGDGSLVGSVFDANLRVTYNYKPASKTWRATMALPATGKFYWEWENEETSGNPGRWNTGLVRYTAEAGVHDFQAYNDVDYVSCSYGGSVWVGTTNVTDPGNGWSSWPTFYSGERMAIAVDMSNGKYWLGKVASGGSTTWYAADSGTDGNPAAGTNEMGTLPNNGTGQWMPYIGWHDGGGAVTAAFTSNINFGQHSFLGTKPSGFDTLSSANLPTPTIKKGSDYFNTVLYTGNNNSNQTISGVGFQPDLVWVKNRDNVERHHLIDAVRGNNKVLFSNEPDAERTGSHGAGHTQLNLASDGFNLVSNGSNDELNFGTRTYVAWNWKESATAGFDIVGFNPSSGTNTYNHSLGVKPDAIFIKSRGSSANWDVYHSKLTAENKLYLNASDAQIDSGFMGDTEPTSSVFSYNPGSQNGNNHIAYLFSNVEGYSKVGKYTGNGDANGSFIYTGFKPVWIIYKKVAAENWHMLDIKRDTLYPNSAGLDPNLYNAEANDANLQMDFLSNGFKLRSSHGTANASGEPYIYMAFAETPFKYANAR